jgi:hypothetical protein
VRAVAFVVVLALPAGADVELGGRPSLRLGAGYDDNLFLDAQATPNPTQIRADGIVDVAPRLLGWLDWRRHLFTLSADYLERVTLSSPGDLRDANVALAWHTPRWGPISLSLGARYEHWATTFYPEDTFDLGGVEAVARAQLHERVALEAFYRFAARYYPDPSRNGQLDDDHRAGGDLQVRAARWLRFNAGYTYLHIGSDSISAELDRHRAEISVEVTPIRQLAISVGYALAWEHLPNALVDVVQNGVNVTRVYAPRSDLVQWLDVALVARPLSWLELWARYQLVDSVVPGASGPVAASGTYHRNQVLAGVGVRWDFAGVFVSRRPLAPLARGTAVTFRHRAPPGRRVDLVGDWNGWAPQPLAEKPGGMYEATYTVPTGRHEYGFRVDGNAVEPLDAIAYVPDGFGGRSGVFTVE